MTQTHFHTIQIGGAIFYVDKEARREIEAFLRTSPAPTDFITVESLLGEEVTVIADAVSGMWDSTPEIRTASRAIAAMFKSEVPVEDL